MVTCSSRPTKQMHSLRFSISCDTCDIKRRGATSRKSKHIAILVRFKNCIKFFVRPKLVQYQSLNKPSTMIFRVLRPAVTALLAMYAVAKKHLGNRPLDEDVGKINELASRLRPNVDIPLEHLHQHGFPQNFWSTQSSWTVSSGDSDERRFKRYRRRAHERSLRLQASTVMHTPLLKSLIDRMIRNIPSLPRPTVVRTNALRELVSVPPPFFQQHSSEDGNGSVDQQRSVLSEVSANNDRPLSAGSSLNLSWITYIPTEEEIMKQNLARIKWGMRALMLREKDSRKRKLGDFLKDSDHAEARPWKRRRFVWLTILSCSQIIEFPIYQINRPVLRNCALKHNFHYMGCEKT